MAFTPASLIAQAKADLEAIEGMGLVYDRRRDVRDEASAKRIWYCEEQNRIHAWSVTLGEPTAKAERSPGFGPRGSGQIGTVLTDMTLQYEGVFGINDADSSEVTFRDLCFEVMNAFNRYALMTPDVVNQGAMQWHTFGYLLLAGMYTVHYAKLSCTYRGRVAP